MWIFIFYDIMQASTYQQDGKVDWEAVGICAGVGGAVGAIAAGAAYGITKAVMNLLASSKNVTNAINNVDANRCNHILQSKHGWSKIGDGGWESVSKAIKHTMSKGSVEAYKAGNSIITATYKNNTVQVVVRNIDDVLQIVDAWIVL